MKYELIEEEKIKGFRIISKIEYIEIEVNE